MYELRRAHFKGNHGKSGKSQKSNGNHGKDIHYSVPLGTEIYEVKRSVGAKKKERIRQQGFGEVKIKVADLDEES